MDDEKNGRGEPGKLTPSISQAELDALIENADVGKSSSTPSQTRSVRPVKIRPPSVISKDFVPGDGTNIDQSELDALLSSQNGDEIMTDKNAQNKGGKDDPGLSQAELDALMGDGGGELLADEPNPPAQAAKSGSAERVLSQEEIDAMLAALGN